jgi:hypothetical protein
VEFKTSAVGRNSHAECFWYIHMVSRIASLVFGNLGISIPLNFRVYFAFVVNICVLGCAWELSYVRFTLCFLRF